MSENRETIEEPTEFIHSKLPSRIDSLGDRFSIIDNQITDNYPSCSSLSYCGGGVWYDRETKEYSGQMILG